MPSKHRAGEVVEAPRAFLAAVALPVRLAVVAAVTDHRGSIAPGATHAFWPAVLAHEGEALGVVHQARQVDPALFMPTGGLPRTLRSNARASLLQQGTNQNSQSKDCVGGVSPKG